MKNSTALLILVSMALFPRLASAQWDYGQHAIDNIIENRIDIRKTRARLKARKSVPSKGRRGAKAGKSARSGSRLVSTSTPRTGLPSHVEFHRDTFQDFRLSDSKGYIVNFVFSSATGKVLRKSYNFTYYNSVAEFRDIPVGKYQVAAQGVYRGKKYPVHLGSEDGTSQNPLGGNFAPSIRIEVKPGKDQWGTKTLLTLPETLHVRVIE